MPRVRRRLVLRFALIALALYAGFQVVGPVAHTDLADHVTSSSHCQVCAANPLAARIEARVTAAAPVLPAIGDAATARSHGFPAPVPFRTSGRSPPA